MKSKKGLKILIGIVVAIVILLLLVSLVAKIIFTKEKLLSLAIPKIEQALNRKVEINDISAFSIHPDSRKNNSSNLTSFWSG